MATAVVTEMAGLLASSTGWQRGILDATLAKFIPTTMATSLPDDESFEDNVKFIRQALGPDVRITKDMPSFHTGCGLQIPAGSIMREIEAAVRLSIYNIIKAITKEQTSNGGFISWRRLQELFDGGEQFTPETDKDRVNSKFVTEEAGRWLWESGAFTRGTPESLMRAKTEMTNFIADPAIFESLKIDLERIGSQFGETGVAVDISNFLGAREARAHVAIDVGCVTFPRLEDPFFKIFRFRVVVLSESTRILLGTTDKGSMLMTLTSRNYKMNDEFKEKFKPEVAEQVDAKFASMMAEIGVEL